MSNAVANIIKDNMGVNYNIIIAEGIILCNPDKYFCWDPCCDLDEKELEEYGEKKSGDRYGIASDYYSGNSPIFVYDKSSVTHTSSISRAYGGQNIKYHEDADLKDKPLYLGVSYPAMFPMDFYDYDNDDLQKQKKIEYMENIRDTIIDEYRVKVLDHEQFMKWSQYGKFTFVYHT